MPAVSSQAVTIRPATALEGVVRVPGDAAISRRYALVGALAEGITRISHFAPGDEATQMLRSLGQLGAIVSRCDVLDRDSGAAVPTVQIVGRGLAGLEAPATDLECGSSRETLSLLAGALAAHPFTSTMTGDVHLRRVPVLPIASPLTAMGADVLAFNGRPPLIVTGGRLQAMACQGATIDGDVKAAVLMAGVQTDGLTTVVDPDGSHDHTERALATFGATLDVHGPHVRVVGGKPLAGRALVVPGDTSLAACWACAAAALPDSFIELRDVGLNPRRTAVFDTLRRMGADVHVRPDATRAGEPVGRARIRHRPLRPVELQAREIPALIAELPALAALATHGGELIVSGATALRDAGCLEWTTPLINGLRALGGDADETADGFRVRCSRRLLGGDVDAAGDARLAIAFAIAGLGALEPTVIGGADAVTAAYPAFFETLAALRR